MFGLIARRSVTKAALPGSARSVTTIISRADTAATNTAGTTAAAANSNATASLSTSASASAPSTHVQTSSRQNRVTSTNRTFHNTASWTAGSDLVSAKSPAALQTQNKMEQARLRRYKNAVEML
ncbi:unnamed protein product [Parajaminaea phylloscopi]